MTAVDTNVIVALWDRDTRISSSAEHALDAALSRGAIVIAPPVFAELTAAPGRTEKFVDAFLRDTGLTVDWALDEAIWRAAGRAYRSYATRRRSQRDAGPRRILADFLIVAHASMRGYHLLTLDEGFYRTGFPELVIDRV